MIRKACYGPQVSLSLSLENFSYVLQEQAKHTQQCSRGCRSAVSHVKLKNQSQARNNRTIQTPEIGVIKYSEAEHVWIFL